LNNDDVLNSHALTEIFFSNKPSNPKQIFCIMEMIETGISCLHLCCWRTQRGDNSGNDSEITWLCREARIGRKENHTKHAQTFSQNRTLSMALTASKQCLYWTHIETKSKIYKLRTNFKLEMSEHFRHNFPFEKKAGL